MTSKESCGKSTLLGAKPLVMIHRNLSGRIGANPAELLLSQRLSPRTPNAKIVAFTKLFWANRGNHNETTAQKFLPEFTFEELKRAGQVALRQRQGRRLRSAGAAFGEGGPKAVDNRSRHRCAMGNGPAEPGARP